MVSREPVTLAMLIVRVTKRVARASRVALGRLVISSNVAARLAKTHSTSCLARKAGCPSSANTAAISSGFMPRRPWGSCVVLMGMTVAMK